MPPTALPPVDLTIRVNQYAERSPGVHFSAIMQSILMDLEPEKYDPNKNPSYMNFFMGLLFERALEIAWVDKETMVRPELIRPGEIRTKEGIIITPDAFDTLKGRPEEYKCTKKSSRQPITDKKFWQYWVQLKAQAYATGSNSGALYILHVNGNYNKDFDDPEASYTINGWEDFWTDLQLEENWSMLMKQGLRKGMLVLHNGQIKVAA